MLKSFLPLVIQQLSVFLSATDIATGTRWTHAVEENLSKSNFGVICITADNLNAPWLNFEAGAISTAIGGSRVAPLLLDLRPQDVGPPLSLFQMVTVSKSDIYSLVCSIRDSEQLQMLDDKVLATTFDAFWPQLESNLKEASLLGTVQPASPRATEEYFAEIVSMLRDMQGQRGSANAVEDGAEVILPGDVPHYIILWDTIASRAGTDNAVIRDIKPGRPDIIVNETIGIETIIPRRMDDPSMSFWIPLKLKNLANWMRELNLRSGLLIVGGEGSTPIEQFAAEAAGLGLGLAAFHEGSFVGTRLAHEIVPWLFPMPGNP